MKKRFNGSGFAFIFQFVVALATWALWGCAHHEPLPEEQQQWIYKVPAEKSGQKLPSLRWAPAFVVYGHEYKYNRIGRPTATLDQNGQERIFVDPAHPDYYVMERTFATEKGTYTNLIYRVHFPKVPFSLIPFNITAGRNVGVLVVVTLDSAQRPILVTTVGTCGCYMVIVPTQYLPLEAYPQDWNFDEQLNKYGERLPAKLQFDHAQIPQLLVHLRPEVHRVMDLEVRDRTHLTSARFKPIDVTVRPMTLLNKLPVSGGHTSFFHQKGSMKGYVKGSVKPWETLLMSLISLDFFVGTDKAYADTADSDNPFYTSLKPWRRQDSNMWNFVRFLNYWGWNL